MIKIPEQRIRYIEKYPDKIDTIFNSNKEYNDFFKKRFKEVDGKLDFFGNNSMYKYDDWIHRTLKINKDGSIRKYYSAVHLQTKESRKKQIIKFREYLEKVRKEHETKRLQREQLKEDAYNNAIKVLIRNKIDLNLLDIRVKRR